MVVVYTYGCHTVHVVHVDILNVSFWACVICFLSWSQRSLANAPAYDATLVKWVGMGSVCSILSWINTFMAVKKQPSCHAPYKKTAQTHWQMNKCTTQAERPKLDTNFRPVLFWPRFLDIQQPLAAHSRVPIGAPEIASLLKEGNHWQLCRLISFGTRPTQSTQSTTLWIRQENHREAPFPAQLARSKKNWPKLRVGSMSFSFQSAILQPNSVTGQMSPMYVAESMTYQNLAIHCITPAHGVPKVANMFEFLEEVENKNHIKPHDE